VAGVSAATAIAQVCAFALLLRTLAARMPLASPQALPSPPSPPSPSSPVGVREEASARKLAGTSLATLLRSSSTVGTWVYIASTVSRQLGPTAIAAHGVVLKVWLLLVLAAEAPAVAGQVLCARAISRGELARARALLKRLLVRCSALGVVTAVVLLALGGPASAFFFTSADPATAELTRGLFRWAAICTPLIAPNALLEAVLLGSGRSYKFLALSTFANALVVTTLTTAAIAVRPKPSTAWACIAVFFVLRITCAGLRLRSPRAGFGRWGDNAREGVQHSS
jgi:Na+-driven multidrug efflux pump